MTRDNLEDSETNVNQRISFADIGSKTSLKLTATLASRHAHYFGQDTTVAAIGQGNNNNINYVNSPSLDPMRFNAIPLQDQENPASSACGATSSLMKLKISDAINNNNNLPALNASEIFLERDPISYQSPILKPTQLQLRSHSRPTITLNDELISLAVLPPLNSKSDCNTAPPTITTHRRNIQTELQQPHQLNEPAFSEIPFSSDRKWILNCEAEPASPIPLRTHHHIRYDSITTEIMISSAGLKDRDDELRGRAESLQDNLDPMQL